MTSSSSRAGFPILLRQHLPHAPRPASLWRRRCNTSRAASPSALGAISTSGREASTNRKSSPSKNSRHAKHTWSKTPSAPTSANHPTPTDIHPYPTSRSSTLAHPTSDRVLSRAPHVVEQNVIERGATRREQEGWRSVLLVTCEARPSSEARLRREQEGWRSVLLVTCEARPSSAARFGGSRKVGVRLLLATCEARPSSAARFGGSRGLQAPEQAPPKKGL